MKLTKRQRWMIWLLALAGTLAAAAWVDQEGAEPAWEQSSGPARASRAAELPPVLALERLARRDIAQPVADPFPAKSWHVPPPPPAQAKPVRTVPPLPFAFAGRLVTDEGTVVFLTRAKRNYAVRKGDVIDGTWRVEEIADTRITMTYLPQFEKQHLAIGAAH